MAGDLSVVRVSPDGHELAGLLEGLPTSGRVLLGVAGAPGAGKSTLAAALVDLAGAGAAAVPLDGFHLADVELGRQALLDRKGAPESFDAWGYAALLRRLRNRPEHVVYAPGFERGLEQPLAGAVAVRPEIVLVVTEGNYLLLDEPGWCAARDCLDAVWFVHTDEDRRRERLLARHVAFGKTPRQAERWMASVDDPNAVLVEEARHRADLVVDLTAWAGA